MKRFLLLLCVVLLFAFANNLYAQCTVSQMAVEVKSITPNANGNGCTIAFELSWTQEVNTGNKYAYVHLWDAGQYHTPAAAWPTSSPIYGSTSRYPQKAQLANTLFNFVIEGNNTATPTLGATYWPDPTVTNVNTSATIRKTPISKTTQRVTIENLSLNSSNCNTLISLQGDIWASQAENKSNVHCASQGLAFGLNDPLVAGRKNCSPERSYDVTITTLSTTPINVNYNVYADNGDGTFSPGAEQDAWVAGQSGINFSGTYTQTAQTYLGYNVPGEQSSLWLEVTKVGNSYSSIAYLPNPCFPLPVSLGSFSVARNKQNVALKWETLTETNNRGFNVQRNTKGVWETVNFVPSQADGGNSTGPLSYTFSDPNDEKGVSQYRLQQVDIDGRATYSPVRSVRGIGQLAKTIVYPNPSANGKVNVVFEDQGLKEITVSDMNGRVVRRYPRAVNNQVIEGLERGMYHIRITDLSSAATTVEKVIIK